MIAKKRPHFKVVGAKQETGARPELLCVAETPETLSCLRDRSETQKAVRSQGSLDRDPAFIVPLAERQFCLMRHRMPLFEKKSS